MWDFRVRTGLALLFVLVCAGCSAPDFREMTEQERRTTPGDQLLCAEIDSEGVPTSRIEFDKGLDWYPEGSEEANADRLGDIVAWSCPEMLFDPGFRGYLRANGVDIPDPPQKDSPWLGILVVGAASLVAGTAGALAGAIIGTRSVRKSLREEAEQKADAAHAEPEEPGWAPDPLLRHSIRWWDGQRWTDDVRD